MDRFPQPPDDPEEGNCRRCKRHIGRDELLIDGCTECDDLLIEDMKVLWKHRPVTKNINAPWYAFSKRREHIGVMPGAMQLKDWRGCI